MHRALLSALISTVFFSFVAAWGQINSISQPSTTTPSGPSVTTTAVGEAAGPHLVTSSAGSHTAQWDSQSGTYANSTVSFKAASSNSATASACDLAAPFGTVDASDVQAAINMALGMSSCTANIIGTGVCNVVVVQRVVNAALPNGTCITDGTVPHSVSLSWVASTTPGVTYNVYRSTTLGSYTTTPLASSISTTSYTDNAVQSGQTYYYVITAANSASESSRSNEVPAAIPVP